MEYRLYDTNDLNDIHSLLKCELGYDVSCEELANRIENMCKDENYCIFVAVEDNQVVGFIGLHFGLAFEISGKLMRIITLAVSHKYQKMSVGKNLIKYSEKYAKNNNVSVITLNRGLTRLGVHAFYEKQGFYKKGYSFLKKT